MGFWNNKTCKVRICTSAQRQNMRKQLSLNKCENDTHQYHDFTDGNVTDMW